MGPPFTLTDSTGNPYQSDEPGTLGGNKRSKIYGRLDPCPPARRALAQGTYQKNRVFFADEATAQLAGYRRCKLCFR